MQIFLLEIEPSCQNAIVLVAQMREQPYPDSGLSLVMQYSHRWPMTGASALIIGRKKTTKRGNTKEERKKKWNQAICTRVQKYKLIPLFFFSLTLDSFLWKAETEKKLKKEIQATENENCAGGGQSDSFPSVQIFTEGSIHLLQRRTPTCEPTRPHQPWDTPFKFRNGEISWRRIHKSSKWINWNWLIENKIPRTITA